MKILPFLIANPKDKIKKLMIFKQPSSEQITIMIKLNKNKNIKFRVV